MSAVWDGKHKENLDLRLRGQPGAERSTRYEGLGPDNPSGPVPPMCAATACLPAPAGTFVSTQGARTFTPW